MEYLLNRYAAGFGYVLSGGLEPYLGYWAANAKQTRKNFSPANPSQHDLVSVERVEGQGLVLGLQGTFHRPRAKSLSNFYGDLILPIDAAAGNSAVPGTTIHSWGIGVEGGASYGKTFGEASRKIVVSVQLNFIALYYNGQTRSDVPGFTFVEWPSNLTLGWSALVQAGGGWFSVLEK